MGEEENERGLVFSRCSVSTVSAMGKKTAKRTRSPSLEDVNGFKSRKVEQVEVEGKRKSAKFIESRERAKEALNKLREQQAEAGAEDQRKAEASMRRSRFKLALIEYHTLLADSELADYDELSEADQLILYRALFVKTKVEHNSWEQD